MDGHEQPNWLLSPVVWAAGLAGAMVSLAHAPALSVRQRFGTVGVGLATAGCFTPAVADGAHLSVNTVAAVGFIFGMVGMVLTAGVIRIAEKARDNPGAAARVIAAALGRKLPDEADLRTPDPEKRPDQRPDQRPEERHESSVTGPEVKASPDAPVGGKP